MAKNKGKWWWGTALATSRTVPHSPKSSVACCPTANISNGASSVGLVTTARVEVHFNKNMKTNPLIKKTQIFNWGQKSDAGLCNVAGCNSFQIGTTLLFC